MIYIFRLKISYAACYIVAMKKNNVVAIIPARGGSKRVPKKNIKDMCGKPLVAWSIEAAVKAKKIDRVIVSTNDKEIHKIARKYGAEVPFLRPEELSGDKVGMEPVLIHAIEWLKENENYKTDIVLLLQLTNPLKRPEDLDNAISILEDTNSDSVVAVGEALGNNNPHWVLKRNEKNQVVLSTGESLKKMIVRSQDLPKHYSRNDIVYVLKPKNLYEKPSNLYGDKVELLVMDEIFYTDINSPEDWAVTADKLRRLYNIKK